MTPRGFVIPNPSTNTLRVNSVRDLLLTEPLAMLRAAMDSIRTEWYFNIPNDLNGEGEDKNFTSLLDWENDPCKQRFSQCSLFMSLP
jgi:hypothetical protein